MRETSSIRWIHSSTGEEMMILLRFNSGVINRNVSQIQSRQMSGNAPSSSSSLSSPSSFRLFDEQKDILILVFLDDIPSYQLSPYYRMRKLLKRKTYLSWQRAMEHPELFWEKLRQALRTRDTLCEDMLLPSAADRP